MSTQRRTLVALSTAGLIAGLAAVTAPIASGAVGGGDNSGPVAVASGAKADPLVAKQDRWAVVNADGTLGRGKGVTSITHTAGGGSYIVIFNKNVRNCMYVGTIGLSGASGTSSRGFITTVGAAVDVNGVFVTTDDTSAAPAERGFHLYVGC
jgi:hypothetical protein